MRTVAELAIKALAGGALVLVFAVLAQLLSPKRLAGVFAAAPSVALASLTVTCLFKGPVDARRACAGMIAGAVGFLTYTLIAPGALKRYGALRGSALTLVSWLAVSVAALPLTGMLPAAKAAATATVAAPKPPAGRPRPRLRLQPSKLSETHPKEAVIRFGFGAGTSVLAGLLSVAAGPFIGGVLLAFPAILLASLTLVADEEGQAAARDDARGARAGSLGLIAFAWMGSALLERIHTPQALSICVLGWLVTGLGAFALAWAAGVAADEDAVSTS